MSHVPCDVVKRIYSIASRLDRSTGCELLKTVGLPCELLSGDNIVLVDKAYLEPVKCLGLKYAVADGKLVIVKKFVDLRKEKILENIIHNTLYRALEDSRRIEILLNRLPKDYVLEEPWKQLPPVFAVNDALICNEIIADKKISANGFCIVFGDNVYIGLHTAIKALLAHGYRRKKDVVETLIKSGFSADSMLLISDMKLLLEIIRKIIADKPDEKKRLLLLTAMFDKYLFATHLFLSSLTTDLAYAMYILDDVTKEYGEVCKLVAPRKHINICGKFYEPPYHTIVYKKILSYAELLGVLSSFLEKASVSATEKGITVHGGTIEFTSNYCLEINGKKTCIAGLW